MKFEKIDADAALTEGRVMPFAFVRTAVKVFIGKTNECPFGDVIPEGLLEARFFNAEEEIRIFPLEEGFGAAKVTEEPGDSTICEKYALENTKLFGKNIDIRRYIGYDCDGQAYIKCTRLSGWEG